MALPTLQPKSMKVIPNHIKKMRKRALKNEKTRLKWVLSFPKGKRPVKEYIIPKMQVTIARLENELKEVIE